MVSEPPLPSTTDSPCVGSLPLLRPVSNACGLLAEWQTAPGTFSAEAETCSALARLELLDTLGDLQQVVWCRRDLRQSIGLRT